MQNIYVKLKSRRIFGVPNPISYVFDRNPRKSGAFKRDLPRKIYLYWDSGLDNCPDIVSLCIHSWKIKNPNWEVIILNRHSAEKFLSRAALTDQIQEAHYADLLRVAILAKHGGVWADATCFCVSPLDNWIQTVVSPSGMFFFWRPWRDRMVSNWFIAAVPDHEPIALLLRISKRFWKGRKKRPKEYFWFHYLFEYCYITNARFRSAWTHTPKLPADMPHTLSQVLRKNIVMDEHSLSAIRNTPVQKLSTKEGYSANDLRALYSELPPLNC